MWVWPHAHVVWVWCDLCRASFEDMVRSKDHDIQVMGDCALMVCVSLLCALLVCVFTVCPSLCPHGVCVCVCSLCVPSLCPHGVCVCVHCVSLLCALHGVCVPSLCPHGVCVPSLCPLGPQSADEPYVSRCHGEGGVWPSYVIATYLIHTVFFCNTCMCTHIHVHVCFRAHGPHTCTHVHTHIQTHTYTHTHTHTHTWSSSLQAKLTQQMEAVRYTEASVW